jgi:hypothetical protein
LGSINGYNRQKFKPSALFFAALALSLFHVTTCLAYSACCEMSLHKASLHNATAGGINTLGGCCARFTKCSLNCSHRDLKNWRCAPDHPSFKHDSKSNKICGSCRKVWEIERIRRSDEDAARAPEAELSRAAEAGPAEANTNACGRRAPTRNESGESFDDEADHYVLLM